MVASSHGFLSLLPTFYLKLLVLAKFKRMHRKLPKLDFRRCVANSGSVMSSDLLREPNCLKFHALARWVKGHLKTIDHERRVAGIAARLFDLTGLKHGMTAEDLRLLRLAAMVHDVGRVQDVELHPEIGAEMVRRDQALPLTNPERRWLAYLTRYHRGRVPRLGRDDVLRSKDDHHRLWQLLAILRAADALDSRATDIPDDLRFRLEDGQLRIICRLPQENRRAHRTYSRRKKFRLLEKMLDCDVRVTVSWPKARPMVA